MSTKPLFLLWLLYSKLQSFVNDIIALEECEVEYYDFEMVDQLLGESLFRRGFLTYGSELILMAERTATDICHP